MDSGIEGILSSFADDTQLCGAVIMLEGRDFHPGEGPGQAWEVTPCRTHDLQQGHVQGPPRRSGQSQAQIQAG